MHKTKFCNKRGKQRAQYITVESSVSQQSAVRWGQPLRSYWGWEWAFVQNPFHAACSRRWF